MYSLEDHLWEIALHNNGHTYAEIANITGIHETTVSRHIQYAQGIREELEDCDPSDRHKVHDLTLRLFNVSEAKAGPRQPYKVKGALRDYLMEICDFERQKTLDLGKRHKQKLRPRQVGEIARERGFSVSNATVRRFMREQLRTPKEAFIEQCYEPGDRFEFDYCECHLKIDGFVRKYYIAVMTAPASGVRFARLCTNMKSEGFIDTHVRFFEYMGGMFREGVYDNLGNAVFNFEKNRHKEFSRELLKLATYYGFAINVTNIEAGNEKGTVENAVDVVRNAAFAPQYEFESFEEAQECLSVAIEFMNTDEMLEYERRGLAPLMPRYQYDRGKFKRKVDKLSCITVAGRRYSVPDNMVGEVVEVHLYDYECRIKYNGKEIACHPFVEEGETAWNIKHFLHTLRNKPGSLARSKVLRSYPLLKAIFDEFYKGKEAEFVEVLRQNANQSNATIATKLLQHADK